MPSRHHPFVLLNMAMTADGKIATANRTVSSFGSARDQAHLLELRATADAVLCGSRTANIPGVTLGPGGTRYQRQRLRHRLGEFNLRVVVSGNARLDPTADVFSEVRSPLVVLVTQQAPTARVRRLERAGAVVARFGEDRVDLPAALAWLYQRWKVGRLVCEGGSELNDAMLRAGLVDEIHVTVCPILFGGRLAPTVADGLGVPNLALAVPLAWTGLRRVGHELFAMLRVVRPGSSKSTRNTGRVSPRPVPLTHPRSR